jgi:hypothetical protein
MTITLRLMILSLASWMFRLNRKSFRGTLKNFRWFLFICRVQSSWKCLHKFLQRIPNTLWKLCQRVGTYGTNLELVTRGYLIPARYLPLESLLILQKWISCFSRPIGTLPKLTIGYSIPVPGTYGISSGAVVRG